MEAQTRVVNLYKEKYDVYIGRQGKGKSGYFGNPIEINKECFICKKLHNREETIECFKIYFYNRIEKDISFKNNILKLKGKILGCFCKPKLCHGDIYVEYLEKEIKK